MYLFIISCRLIKIADDEALSAGGYTETVQLFMQDRAVLLTYKRPD